MIQFKVIRREVLIDEGQIFNNHLWELSILRLNQLGYFEPLKAGDAAADISLEVESAAARDDLDGLPHR